MCNDILPETVPRLVTVDWWISCVVLHLVWQLSSTELLVMDSQPPGGVVSHGSRQGSRKFYELPTGPTGAENPPEVSADHHSTHHQIDIPEESNGDIVNYIEKNVIGRKKVFSAPFGLREGMFHVPDEEMLYLITSARPTNDISIEFEIRPKFGVLQFKTYEVEEVFP